MVNLTFHLSPGPILLYIAVLFVSVQAFWKSFDMISIENSKTGIITTDLKVKRFNKTAYGISGTVGLTADLNDDFDCEMKAYFSSKGDSKFTLMPYKVPRDACCTHAESSYWKGVERTLRECSDIPERVAGEKFCLTLKKNVHEVRQFGFNYNVIPMHMDPGVYKIEILLYEKGSPDFSSKATFVARLY